MQLSNSEPNSHKNMTYVLPTMVSHQWKMEEGIVKVEDYSTEPKERDPSQKDLCECIIMIKERFPNCRLDRVIQLLHDALLKQQNQMREQARKKASLLLQPQDDYLSDDSVSQIQKKKMQQQYARKFQNSDANPRFYQEREIAKLFCSKGYGYPTARQYLGENITPNRYNNVITTIVRLSYRKLEYYIVKHLDSKLKTITREQLKMIKTPLVNCRNWMTRVQADNFHRFVKLTYKIHTEEPDIETIIELHESIMGQLKKRNLTYKHHRRGEEYHGWTEEMEQQLIVSSLKYTDFSDVQRQMISHYPSSRGSLQIGKLKFKLGRLVRLALKKIQSDKTKFAMEDSTILSEFLINKIIQSPKANQTRVRCLSYFLDKDTNVKKLRWVVEAVNQYLVRSRDQVEEIQDSSCEYLPKQQLKSEVVKISDDVNNSPSSTKAEVSVGEGEGEHGVTTNNKKEQE